MRNLYCLFLDRNDTREGLKTILEGIDYIKKGISIVIFPEGTTSHTLDLLPFKEGSFKFAEKTGCKIIPWSRIIQEPVLKISFRESKRHIPLSNSANLLTLNPFQKRKENLLVTM